MVESGHKLGRLFGGLSDLEATFLTTVRTRPLVPVIAGPAEKCILAIHSPEEKIIYTVCREQLGYFIDREPFDAQELRLLCRVADELVESKKPVCHPGEDVGGEEPDDDGVYQRLVALAAIVEEVSSLHGKVEDRLAHVSKVEVRDVFMPHTCFLDLAHQFVARLAERRPAAFLPVEKLAQTLVVEQALPACFVKRIALPLFVPQLYETKETVMFNGDEQEVSRYCWSVRAFAGFGYEAEKQQTCIPWNGCEGDSVKVKLAFDLTTDKEISTVYRLEHNVKAAIERVTTSGKAPSERWRRAMNRLNALADALHDRCFQVQSCFVKNVKNFFSTALGTAIMQNQLSLITPTWSSRDVLNACESEEAALQFLIQFTEGRTKKMAALLTNCPSNMFNVTDVTVTVRDGAGSGEYGSIDQPGHSTASSKPSSVKLRYVPAGSNPSRASRALLDLGIECGRLAIKGERTDKVLQYGLWSTYNSTDYTDYGNLCAKDPTKNYNQTVQVKDPVTTIDPRKWIYEVKVVPVNEPCNVLAWFYNARYAMVSTLGAAIVFNWANQDVNAKTFDKTVNNTQMGLLMKTMRLEATRGFFARVKDLPGNQGNTFALTAPVTTTKGYPLTSGQVMTTKTPQFGALEWLAGSIDDGCTERFRYLRDTYNVKSMLQQYEAAGNKFYYKRPFFASARGAAIKMSAVVKNKKNYVFSPVAFLVSHNVTCSMGTWCTTSLETTEPWTNLNVYRLIIEPNACLYSRSKLQEWNSFESKTSAMEVNWMDIASELLEDSDMVTTSQINAYAISKATYTMIVEHLTNIGKYVQDAEPSYTEVSQEDVEEQQLAGPPSHHPAPSGKRDAESALETLTKSLSKRQKLYD